MQLPDGSAQRSEQAREAPAADGSRAWSRASKRRAPRLVARLAWALVRDRPAGVGERELERALAGGWQIHAVATQYAPVGGGSYHWAVRDSLGRRWFATVDDLDGKYWLGDTRAAVSKGLRTAMDTAFALRHHAELGFVVAPVPALHGETVRRLGSKYAITVFPFVHGTSGRFGAALSAGERGQLVEMLAALHRSTPAAAQAARCPVAVPRRGVLEAALRELDQPWHGGPFSEPARALIAGTAGHIQNPGPRRFMTRPGRYQVTVLPVARCWADSAPCGHLAGRAADLR